MSRSTERVRKAGLPTLLSTPPQHAWPEGVIHHGVRLVLLVSLALFATALFPPEAQLRVARYSAGMVAGETVIARVPFSVPLGDTELARARQEARQAVPPTFDYRPEAADSTAARLTAFFDGLDTAAEGGAPTQLLARALRESSIEPTAAQVDLVAEDDTRALLRRTALRAAREILPEGVADGGQLRDVTTDRITVRTAAGERESERSVPRDQVLSARDFYDAAVDLLPAAAPPDVQDLLRVILIQHMEFSYELNVPATDLDRDQAARAVQMVRQSVLEGEAIVRANERITPAILESLEAYQNELRMQGLLDEEGARLAPVAGQTLLNLLLLGVFGLLLLLFRHEIYTNMRWVVLMAALVAVYLAAAAVVSRSGWPIEALPIAFVALAVAVLWDGRMALVLALVLAVFSGVQPGLQGVSVVVTTLMGGTAAAMSVRAVRRRAQTWIFIAIITGAYAAVILALSLVQAREPSLALAALAAGGANAVLSAIVAMGFLPVFEWFTGITTDQTLLEWADPNRDLLRRLSMEAPVPTPTPSTWRISPRRPPLPSARTGFSAGSGSTTTTWAR
jgi:membrane-associated HD superfamily phosphohydrolase